MIPRQQLLDLKRRWTPPRGLEQSRPRDVRFTAAGWTLAIVSGALVVAGWTAGIALFVSAGRQQDERLRLREHGVNTDAVVTRLWTTNGEERHHMVAFQFSVVVWEAPPLSAVGSLLRPVDGRERIPRASWSTLRVGSRIPVRYDPTNPQVYVTFGREPRALGYWVPYAVGLGLFACGLAATLPLMSQRRLLVEGRPAPGVVIQRKKTHGMHGRRHQQIRYEFLLLNGSAHTGVSAAQKLQEGQPIEVLYEPDDPGRNALYPLALVRPARLS